MKVKFNWGTGIFIVIIIFFMGMAFLIYLCTTVDYSLVEKDYYPKGIDYQTRINKIQNAAPFSDQLNFRLAGDSLLLSFPKGIAGKVKTGTVYIYRPSDPGLDRRIKMEFDTSGIQVIKTEILHRGKYIAKLEWKDLERSYYAEKTIIIP